MKLRCTNPEHNDETPSMELYPKFGYCFVCQWIDKSVGDSDAKEVEKENLQETIKYIKSLPKVYIRELQLHTDGSSYYIVWPDDTYYKRRLLNGKTRYTSPKGHTQPLLVYKSESKNLVVVEGELNAMSLHQVRPDLNIVSPGSATNLCKYYNVYLTMKDIQCIFIVVDRDPAGVAAGVSLKKLLQQRGRRVTLIGCEKDCNEILQEEGPEGLKEWSRQNMGL